MFDMPGGDVCGGVILRHSTIQCNWSICDASCWSTSSLSTGCPTSISGNYSGRFWYRHDYLNNENCKWRITVPSGYSVKVVFSHLNKWEVLDYLRIYDGPSASSPLLVILRGDLSTPRGVISTGSSLWFNFVMDRVVSRRGFEAAFTAVNSSLSGKSPNMNAIAVIIPVWQN